MEDLPPEYGIRCDYAENKTYVLYTHRYIVTKHTGSKKWFRGVEEKTKRKAAKWLWRYYDGFVDGFKID